MCCRWNLAYATHLGYQPPEYLPLFGGELRTAPLVDHVRCAAALGFSGVLYPWALERPLAEVRDVASAMKDLALRGSAVVSTPLKEVKAGIWVRRDRASREALARHVRRAVEIAHQLRADTLATLIVGIDDSDVGGSEQQWATAVTNFDEMARICGQEGMSLAIEPMRSMPSVVVHSVETALAFLSSVSEPSAGIIFDTGHVASSDGDLIRALDAAFERVRLVQLADLPGRVEPGAGELELVSFVRRLLARGYLGLVDLEHGWSDDDAAGLRRLRAFDALVGSAI